MRNIFKDIKNWLFDFYKPYEGSSEDFRKIAKELHKKVMENEKVDWLDDLHLLVYLSKTLEDLEIVERFKDIYVARHKLKIIKGEKL